MKARIQKVLLAGFGLAVLGLSHASAEEITFNGTGWFTTSFQASGFLRDSMGSTSVTVRPIPGGTPIILSVMNLKDDYKTDKTKLRASAAVTSVQGAEEVRVSLLRVNADGLKLTPQAIGPALMCTDRFEFVVQGDSMSAPALGFIAKGQICKKM